MRATAIVAGEGRADDGFTLVELIVSLTVMAIGVVGVIGVINSSFMVAAGASARARAVSVATEQIEAMRAVPYDALEVAEESTVSTQEVGGMRFTVEQAVTRAHAATILNAYKRGYVVVSWTDRAGFHSIHQSTLIYPGGRGPAASTATTVATPTDTPLAPNPLTAAKATTGTDDVAVDLAWTVTDPAHVATFTVQYTTGSTTVLVTDSLPADSRTLRVNGLSASTEYRFHIAAVSEAGTRSGWTFADPVTTDPPATGDCVIGTPSVDPARVARRSASEGATLVVNPMFSVNTTGACGNLSITFEPTRHEPVTRAVSGSSGLRTAVIDGQTTRWDVGATFVELFDASGTKRATVKLQVCEQGAPECP